MKLHSRVLGVLFLFCLSTATLIGCGGSAGYHVSGVVNFDGKPIPTGKIYFTPDGSKNNVGPTGYATIKNGVFNTATSDGKPTAGGPMIVKIEGFDPSAKGPQNEGDTSGEVTIKSLFPAYEMAATLEKSTSKQNFDVPLEAADRKSAPETNAGNGP